MAHHTKDKGDIGTAQTIADLTKKGYVVFAPIICEHLPFDLIAYKDNISYRIQCKYSSNGYAAEGNVHENKQGYYKSLYKETDFDYYSIYLPEKDVVIYPSIKFAGHKFAREVPNSATPFYWYKDFLTFTDVAEKKTYRDFGFELTHNVTKAVVDSRIKRRKVVRPSKEELLKLLWEKQTMQISKQFGVSDVAISKWAKQYGISKPPRGYWAKKKYGKV